MDNYGKLTDYRNLDTHWFECRTCRGKSPDSDTYALMGHDSLTPAAVTHDTNCPGKVFPEGRVRRVTKLY